MVLQHQTGILRIQEFDPNLIQVCGQLKYDIFEVG